MRSRILVTAALLAAAALSLKADRLPAVDVREHVLANGFRLIMAPRPYGGMVSVRMVFGEGSVHDPPGVSGMAHFFEHLVYEGTARLGTLNWPEERKILDRLWAVEEQIERERNRLAREQPHRNGLQLAGRDVPLTEPLIAPDAALRELEQQRDALREQRKRFNRPLDINQSYYYWGDTVSYAGTGVDATQYFALLPAPHLEAAFWIEADKFEPVFRNFYEARDTVQEQVLRGSIDHDAEFARRMAQLSFSSSFGRPSGGGYELEQASPLDARRFKEEYLVPHNSHMVLVGEFDPQGAVRLAERYFGRIPRGAPPPRVRVIEPEPAGEKRLTVEGPGRPRVELRFQIPPGAVPANAPLDLVIELLNGAQGRLAATLKSEEDLVTTASAARRTTRHWAYVSIVAFPRHNGLIPAVESKIIELLDGLSRTPIAAADVDAARKRAEMQLLRTMADSDALARELATHETVSSWKDFFQQQDQWDKVTPESLRRAARATFDRANRTIGVYRNARSSS